MSRSGATRDGCRYPESILHVDQDGISGADALFASKSGESGMSSPIFRRGRTMPTSGREARARTVWGTEPLRRRQRKRPHRDFRQCLRGEHAVDLHRHRHPAFRHLKHARRGRSSSLNGAGSMAAYFGHAPQARLIERSGVESVRIHLDMYVTYNPATSGGDTATEELKVRAACAIVLDDGRHNARRRFPESAIRELPFGDVEQQPSLMRR